MNYSIAVFLINKNLHAVLCTYEADEGAKRTLFKTLDKTVSIGDYVVVQTDTRHKMTVCKVVEVDVDVDFDSTLPVTWVISKIDREAYEQLLAQETTAIQAIKSAELRQKRDALRQAMFADHLETLKTLPIADMSDNRDEGAHI